MMLSCGWHLRESGAVQEVMARVVVVAAAAVVHFEVRIFAYMI